MRGREDIFLSQSEAEKMSLFRKIVNSRTAQIPVADRLAMETVGQPLVKEVNLKQIASLTGRNYGSVYNTYNGLVEILAEMVPSRKPNVTKLFNLPSSEVRLHFVERGHPYQFLQALLLHTYVTFDDFLAATDASKATMLRHLKSLRDFARKFDVRFSYESMRMHGEEKRVRVFLTMAMWLATDGAGWPFIDLPRDLIGRMVDDTVAVYDAQTSNMVTREIAMYYVAVSYYRIHDGHGIDYNEKALILKYPTANLFEALPDDAAIVFHDTALTQSQQLGESAAIYFLFNFLPFYVTTDRNSLMKTLRRFERYNQPIYLLVTEFLAKLPVAFLTDSLLPAQAMNMLEANLLANTVSTLEFGADLAQTIAYEINDKLHQMPDNAALEKKVRQTLEHVIFTQHLEQLEPHVDVLTKSFYRNVLQLAVQFLPPVKVKVAPVIEQTVLGYVDLLAFLISVPFVEIMRPEDGLVTADLIIESSTVPDAAEKRGQALTYKWAASSSNDWFGELYATIRQIWDNKMSLGGSMDY